MRTVLAFAILITLFYSCTTEKTTDQDLIVLDLTQDLTIKSDMKLSDIAKDIKYTKLESNIDCFVQQVNKYSITDKYLLIYDRIQDLIFLYNREGKFLRKISRVGNGPGEYNRPNDVRISSCEKFILIHNQKQVNRYDFEGKLLGSTPLPSWAIMVDTYKDGLIGMYPSFYSKLMDNYTLVTFDWQGNITGQYGKRNWDWLTQEMPMQRSKYYHFDNLICYHENYYDTVYCLTPDLEFKPRIYLKSENNNAKLRKITDDQEKMNLKGFQLGGWLETPDHFFITGPYNRRFHALIYHKKDNKAYYTPGLIPNDLDGGAPFWPSRYIDDKLYRLDYANRVKSALDNELLDQAEFKNQKLRDRLLAFKENLSEEDGMVLVEVTLK